MIYALIVNNIVTNLIIAGQDFIDSQQGQGIFDTAISFKEGQITPNINDIYDGKTFTSPPSNNQSETLDIEVANLQEEVTTLTTEVAPLLSPDSQVSSIIQPTQL